MLKKIFCVNFILSGFYITPTLANNDFASETMGQQLEITDTTDFLNTNKSNVNLNAANFESNIDINSIYKQYIKVKPDVPNSKRGVTEASLYEKASPSVVLILTNEGSGSGSIISNNGEILTNWHVVAGYEHVAVVFKPAGNKEISEKNIFKAKVTKYDEVKDMAMLVLLDPPKNIRSLPIGKRDEIKVGHDVHAIGHPNGESWTYTKGFISQLRNNYEWTTQMGVNHRANVIQTQTPINPGNSGGPLIDNSGKIIGVNSFKAQGEAMNFAIEVDEIRSFISSKNNIIAEKTKTECGLEPKYSQRTDANDAIVEYYDMDCSGKIDSMLTLPDDKSEPIVLSYDSTGNGKFDRVFVDQGQDGTWDFSFHDTDEDEKPNLIGHHPDGEIEPSRYSEYES